MIRAVRVIVDNVVLRSNDCSFDHYIFRDLKEQFPKDITIKGIRSCYGIDHEKKEIILWSSKFKESPEIQIPEVTILFTKDENNIVTTKVVDIEKHYEQPNLISGANPPTSYYKDLYAGMENKDKEKEKSIMLKKAKTKKDKVKDFFFPEHNSNCKCGNKYIRDAYHKESCPESRKDVKQ